jgi:hypothetical protein
VDELHWGWALETILKEMHRETLGLLIAAAAVEIVLATDSRKVG